jgi:hypothetical protein
MAFAHAFQFPSLNTPAIASTRSEIIRGFIPLVVAIALLHALAALALPYTSIHINPSTWLTLLIVCATCSAASLCCLRLVFAPADLHEHHPRPGILGRAGLLALGGVI